MDVVVSTPATTLHEVFLAVPTSLLVDYSAILHPLPLPSQPPLSSLSSSASSSSLSPTTTSTSAGSAPSVSSSSSSSTTTTTTTGRSSSSAPLNGGSGNISSALPSSTSPAATSSTVPTLTPPLTPTLTPLSVSLGFASSRDTLLPTWPHLACALESLPIESFGTLSHLRPFDALNPPHIPTYNRRPFFRVEFALSYSSSPLSSSASSSISGSNGSGNENDDGSIGDKTGMNGGASYIGGVPVVDAIDVHMGVFYGTPMPDNEGESLLRHVVHHNPTSKPFIQPLAFSKPSHHGVSGGVGMGNSGRADQGPNVASLLAASQAILEDRLCAIPISAPATAISSSSVSGTTMTTTTTTTTATGISTSSAVPGSGSGLTTATQIVQITTPPISFAINSTGHWGKLNRHGAPTPLHVVMLVSDARTGAVLGVWVSPRVLLYASNKSAGRVQRQLLCRRERRKRGRGMTMTDGEEDESHGVEEETEGDDQDVDGSGRSGSMNLGMNMGMGIGMLGMQSVSATTSSAIPQPINAASGGSTSNAIPSTSSVPSSSIPNNATSSAIPSVSSVSSKAPSSTAGSVKGAGSQGVPAGSTGGSAAGRSAAANASGNKRARGMHQQHQQHHLHMHEEDGDTANPEDHIGHHHHHHLDDEHLHLVHRHDDDHLGQDHEEGDNEEDADAPHQDEDAEGLEVPAVQRE
eukprot:ANDGO_00430.mRNA.1 hypothetical protein